ncbi:hypothetical protein C8R44DRAFT_728714 [Mycena epipterygia]|nr:hypothetical protein C8R44DRAFT_728714 [Mycena epipterygia]
MHSNDDKCYNAHLTAPACIPTPASNCQWRKGADRRGVGGHGQHMCRMQQEGVLSRTRSSTPPYHALTAIEVVCNTPSLPQKALLERAGTAGRRNTIQSGKCGGEGGGREKDREGDGGGTEARGRDSSVGVLMPMTSLTRLLTTLNRGLVLG